MTIDIKLYKLKVIAGEENTAKEWLDFLNRNREAGINTLQNEKIYLESYFSSIEGDTMYIYMYVAGENIDYANNVALKSENELDLKHFDYMKKCIVSGDTMDCLCYMDNLPNINNLRVS
jgi:hypothetical protein